jgi:hypothetical protein
MQDRWTTLEGSLASSVPTWRFCYPYIYPRLPMPYSASGLDPGYGVDIVPVHLRTNYATAQRGTAAMPWRSEYGDTSIRGPLRAWTGPYGWLVWSWPPRHTSFFAFSSSTEKVGWWKDLLYARPIIPADCSSWDPCLHFFLDLWPPNTSTTCQRRWKSTVAPGGVSVTSIFLSSPSFQFFSSHFVSCFRDTGAHWPGFLIFILFDWGHWEMSYCLLATSPSAYLASASLTSHVNRLPAERLSANYDGNIHTNIQFFKTFFSIIL